MPTRKGKSVIPCCRENLRGEDVRGPYPKPTQVVRQRMGQQTASGIDRRNLRGRCGGFDGKGRKSQTTTYRPFRALVSSEAGVAARDGKRGACPSLAKPPPNRGAA